MSPDAILTLVLLGPPAVFGLAVAVDDWRARRRIVRKAGGRW